MYYDEKKAIKRLNKLIGYLSDLIINEEDAEYPKEDLIKYYSKKQNELIQLKHHFYSVKPRTLK